MAIFFKNQESDVVRNEFQNDHFGNNMEKYLEKTERILVREPQTYSRREILGPSTKVLTVGIEDQILEIFRRLCCFKTCWSQRVCNKWVVQLTQTESLVSGAGFSWELNKFGLSMLLSLKMLWKPATSTDLVCQHIFSAVTQPRCKKGTIRFLKWASVEERQMQGLIEIFGEGKMWYSRVSKKEWEHKGTDQQKIHMKEWKFPERKKE